MKKTSSTFQPLKNSRGMLSAEFIFALILCAGLCMVLFALNFTLSMAEVAQYIAFSSSRAHAAGHIDQEHQIQRAQAKYQSLVNNPVLKPLFNNPDSSWFQLGALDIRGGGASGSTFDEEYGTAQDRVPKVGLRFTFSPRLLNMKIAFLGSTSEDPDAGFSAQITGFLIREPTQQECWNLQIRQRHAYILNLDSRYKILGGATANKYVPMEDNGC